MLVNINKFQPYILREISHLEKNAYPNSLILKVLEILLSRESKACVKFDPLFS